VPKTTDFDHTCEGRHAGKFWEWINQRGGIAIWKSINLSDPGMSVSTPANQLAGEPSLKPRSDVASDPAKIHTDPDRIGVTTYEEVKRFRVGIRRGDQGLVMKVTDGGTRRIHAAVEKAGDGAYHAFDYDTQEAVIMAPVDVIPLSQWAVEY
jgi:hypothetical protein